MTAQLWPRVLSAVVPALVEPWLDAPFLSLTGQVDAFRRLPEADRRSWQQHRLQQLLDEVTEHVPAYRRQRRAAGRPLVLVDFPPSDKKELRTHLEAHTHRGAGGIRTVAKRTGGTTGDPWQYRLDALAWSQMYAAKLSFWRDSGWRYGQKVVMLGAPPSLVSGARSPRARLRYALERQVVSVSGAEVDEATSLRRAREAASHGASALWYGYAGTVAAMAAAVLAHGVQVLSPRAVVVSSETLQPAWRRDIERAFRAPVLDQYGCNDGGLMSQACSQGRFHIAETLSVVEVLSPDGMPLPAGEEGDVAVTNLHQRSMPFIRYRIGDRAALGEGPCPCGVTGPTFARFAGRTWDRLSLANGRTLGSLAFYPIFLPAVGILRWQVQQTGAAVLVVRLETTHGFSAQEAARVVGCVRAVAGPGVAVRLTTDEPIEVSASGKARAIVGLSTS